MNPQEKLTAIVDPIIGETNPLIERLRNAGLKPEPEMSEKLGAFSNALQKAKLLVMFGIEDAEELSRLEQELVETGSQLKVALIEECQKHSL